jgi:hypothetical protein
MVVTVLFLIKGYVVLWWYDAFKKKNNCELLHCHGGEKNLPLSNFCSKNGVGV